MSEIQAALQRLLSIPDLVLSDSLDPATIEVCIGLFDQLKTPVTADDAVAMVELLNRSDDDMFEANWTLLHAIEDCEAWPVWEVLDRCNGAWSRRLRQRLANAGIFPA